MKAPVFVSFRWFCCAGAVSSSRTQYIPTSSPLPRRPHSGLCPFLPARTQASAPFRPARTQASAPVPPIPARLSIRPPPDKVRHNEGV